MANGATHIWAGCVAGFAAGLIDQREKFESGLDPIASSAIGAVFGKLPDWLEPASNPHHRQFFHSGLMFAVVCVGFNKAFKWKPADPIEKLIRSALLAAAGGYASHLLLDATTPRSLPIIGTF